VSSTIYRPYKLGRSEFENVSDFSHCYRKQRRYQSYQKAACLGEEKDLLMTVCRIPGETRTVRDRSARPRKDRRRMVRIVLTEFRGCGGRVGVCVCVCVCMCACLYLNNIILCIRLLILYCIVPLLQQSVYTIEWSARVFVYGTFAAEDRCI